jgi:outer membrane protein assembly factor BamB
LVAVLNNEALLVVQADDGTEVGYYPWETGYQTNATTPIVYGQTVFISTGYRRGCTLLRWDDRDLVAVYENRHMSNHMNNCVLWDGYLYGIDGNATPRRQVKLACMDYRTGRLQWAERGLGCGALMVADGKLIALGDQGDLVVAEASPQQYRELSRAKVLKETCWTMPVLSGGCIYCRNDVGDLVCVDVRIVSGGADPGHASGVDQQDLRQGVPDELASKTDRGRTR